MIKKIMLLEHVFSNIIRSPLVNLSGTFDKNTGILIHGMHSYV